jgi:hypothetical protein
VDFVDRKGGIHEPVKPPLPLEETPFKLVEELNDLREMCIKLKSVTEFAVGSDVYLSILAQQHLLAYVAFTSFLSFVIVLDHYILSTTFVSVIA